MDFIFYIKYLGTVIKHFNFLIGIISITHNKYCPFLYIVEWDFFKDCHPYHPIPFASSIPLSSYISISFYVITINSSSFIKIQFKFSHLVFELSRESSSFYPNLKIFSDISSTVKFFFESLTFIGIITSDLIISVLLLIWFSPFSKYNFEKNITANKNIQNYSKKLLIISLIMSVITIRQFIKWINIFTFRNLYDIRQFFIFIIIIQIFISYIFILIKFEIKKSIKS